MANAPAGFLLSERLLRRAAARPYDVRAWSRPRRLAAIG